MPVARSRGLCIAWFTGSTRLFPTLLWSTPGCQALNTAYIKRLNETFRSRPAVLDRQTRRSARNFTTVARGKYLVGTVYNFCTTHDSLPNVDGRRQTPAIAAGITDPVWTVNELLHYRVPPAHREPPRRRGRRSRMLQALIDRWRPDHRLAWTYPRVLVSCSVLQNNKSFGGGFASPAARPARGLDGSPAAHPAPGVDGQAELAEGQDCQQCADGGCTHR